MVEFVNHDRIIGFDIKDDVWIATNYTILDEVTIGKGTVIDAGVLIKKMCFLFQVLKE